jgi:predicted enzyme related to lactoylglutathione lyase
MEQTHRPQGLATLNFFAADHKAEKEWYTNLLGVSPYFERPGYVEFRTGDYQHELAIIDARYAPPETNKIPEGAITYWHVNDVEGTLDRLLLLGAKLFEKIMVRGEGFITASVIDTFGNILGIMYNRHYLEVLNQLKGKTN